MKIAQAVLCPVVNGKWVDLIKKDFCFQFLPTKDFFGGLGSRITAQIATV